MTTPHSFRFFIKMFIFIDKMNKKSVNNDIIGHFFTHGLTDRETEVLKVLAE